MNTRGLAAGMQGLLALAAGWTCGGTPAAAMAPGVALEVEAARAWSESRGGRALLVWRGGRLLHESYANGWHAARADWVLSVTKSLVAMGLFDEAASGRLRLDRPVADDLAAWRHDDRRSITLADLLNQASGLPPAYERLYRRGLIDKNAEVLSLRPVQASGRIFRYGPSHYEALAAWGDARWKEGMRGWLARRLPAARAGELPEWRLDGSGKPYLSTGARLTARDLAGAGRVMLQRLRAGGGKGWPEEVRRALANGSPANPMYALGFWINRNAALAAAQEMDAETTLADERTAEFWARTCLSRAAPPDLVAMVGSGGRRVYVVPSQDLVVVRLGSGGGFSDPAFLRCLFGGR